MAARAGRENEVAIAIRRRLAALAPARLTGERPGILSVFVEDTDRRNGAACATVSNWKAKPGSS